MTNISFFKNTSDAVRSNAVLFVGHLLGNYPKENQKILSKEHITNGNKKIDGILSFLFLFFNYIICFYFKL
jgi:hypothetical protein